MPPFNHIYTHPIIEDIYFSVFNSDSSTKKYIQMCKKEIEKQDVKLQATYKAMFRGSTSTSKDNANSKSNDLSLGDFSTNHIEVKETS